MYDFDITRVRNILAALKISVPEASKLTGIKQATLYNYLNEKTPITVDALLLISNKLEFDIIDVIMPEREVFLAMKSAKLNVQENVTLKKGNKKGNILMSPSNVHKNSPLETTDITAKEVIERLEMLEAVVGRMLLKDVGASIKEEDTKGH